MSIAAESAVSGVSPRELLERLGCDKAALRAALDELVAGGRLRSNGLGTTAKRYLVVS